MHLLLKLLNGTRYTGGVDLVSNSRNDDQILQIQEPIGYLFFLSDNVTMIIDELKSSLPVVHGQDVIEYMLTLFYRYGSTRSGVEVHDAQYQSDQLSRQTIDELKQLYTDETTLHDEYRKVLDNPNQIGPMPEHNNNIRSRGKQYSRYELDL